MRSAISYLLWIPFLGTAAALLAFGKFGLQRIVAVTTLLASLVLALLLLFRVRSGEILVVHMGGWPPGIGITLVLDLLSALVLTVALAVLLGVLIFAIVEPGTDDEALAFHPSYLAMATGVVLATITGDLFNFFVAFEIILLASFFLLTFTAGADGIRAGITYVVINVVISALFLIAIALAYYMTGTVSFAQLSEGISALSPDVQEVLWAFLFFILGVKAAIFPLFMWLPDSYPVARSPVTAVFAGLLTKIGIYGIIRMKSVMFPVISTGKVIVVIAALTMVVGVFGAIAQSDMKRILSFHVVSQVGYMIFGVGLATVAGFAGAIFFMLHQIPVKASLFLVGGVIEEEHRTTSLEKLGGIAHRRPWLSTTFVLAALSLAGFPPFSGFAAKIALIRAGIDVREYATTGVAAVVSILTLYSMVKIWGNVFWGSPAPEGGEGLRNESGGPGGEAGGGFGQAAYDSDALSDWRCDRSVEHLTVAAAGLVGLTLAIALLAGPLYDLSLRAAEQIMDPGLYVRAVLR